jgi:hypothetical protein
VTDLQTRIDVAQRRVQDRIRRTAPAAVLVRAGLFGCGVLALLLGWPFEIVASPAFLLFLIAATVPAIAPRTMAPAVIIFLAILGWTLAIQEYGEAVEYPRLVVLAAALYLVHTLSALAAVLPYDAVVAPNVLTRWLGRAGLVLLVTAVLAVFVLAFPALVGGRTFLLASLTGLTVMAVIVGYLARLVGRR